MTIQVILLPDLLYSVCDILRVRPCLLRTTTTAASARRRRAFHSTADNDGDRNPDFLKIFLNEFDAISPWLVGRFRTEEDATRFAENRLKDDVTLINETNEDFARHGVDRKIDYVPVVWPGFSVRE